MANLTFRNGGDRLYEHTFAVGVIPFLVTPRSDTHLEPRTNRWARSLPPMRRSAR